MTLSALLIGFFLSVITLLPALAPNDLSLEEKVGQVLMVHFYGKEANEEAKRLIQEAYIGGVIYYRWANELINPYQVFNLSKGLQTLVEQTPHQLPLLIAVDQEGGRVNRLDQGFTIFPGNLALATANEWAWGKESARLNGLQLKSVGISMNLAPVVDIYHPSKIGIGIRAFCSDPYKVAAWGNATLDGYKVAGMIATLKHFPGLGEVEVDSHEALPILMKSKEMLEKSDLIPFRILAPQADVIMTSHLLVPALDSEFCATFSERIVHNLLRKDLGFEGVIMTDSLVMKGAVAQCSLLEEAVLKSLIAGHDLILLGGKELLSSQKGFECTIKDVKNIHSYLVKAVKEGRLPESRLNDAVSRILILKEKYGLLTSRLEEINSSEFQKINLQSNEQAKQIACHALRLIKGREQLPIAINSPQTLFLVPNQLRSQFEQTSWHSEGQAGKTVFYGINPDSNMIQTVLSLAKKAKQCFYFSCNCMQYSGQKELFQAVKSASPFTVAIALCDPFDADELKSADVVLCTHSPASCSLQAAFEFFSVKQ